MGERLRSALAVKPLVKRLGDNPRGQLMPDEITTGELGRRIEALERNMDRRFRETNDNISSSRFLSVDRYLAEKESQDLRIRELEDARRRFAQWVITGALLPILVIIVIQLLQLR